MRNFNMQAEIRGALRNVARRMPAKQEALRLAIHPTERGVRGGKLYICNHCGLCFKREEVQVDHKEPVIPLDREIRDWNEYIERLFCSPNNLQVLCKPCHQIKSNGEKEIRKYGTSL